MPKKNNRAGVQPKPPKKSDSDFPIVAIGASAGGIEAVTELVKNLPADTGMGFVVIQHLDPHHESLLTDLLSRQTKMTVREVTEGAKVEPNHIYVIPPNTSMSIRDHVLQLRPRDQWRGVHMPIDYFMRALAEADGNRSIGVILSGSGTDGTLGMAEIQAQAGLTFAQDEATAKHNSMPRSAIEAGCVDHVLPPKAIAEELARIAALTPHLIAEPEGADAHVDGPALGTIFQLLRRSTGVDFTHYRQTTILRRIQRRMIVLNLEKLEDYTDHLQTHGSEVRKLYQDILINVTTFFRNPTVFDLMKSLVFPAIMKLRNPDSVIRIWDPGCASGEETYSLAMALLEFLGDKGPIPSIQLFGTDVSESSISKARVGIYPENISEDVSPARLKRFFHRVESGYRISKTIRDMCIFAEHNLVSDPPFSQVDLICCRNLLIYLEPILQHKVLSLFHYAAKPHGFLILGTAEGLGNSTHLFSTEDRSYKIYSKKSTASRPVVSFSLARREDRAEPTKPPGPPNLSQIRSLIGPAETALNFVDIQREFDRKLLTQFSPATVLVNDDLEIVHSRGDVNRFLKIAPGRASLSILKMAREGLFLDLRNAVNRARKDGKPVRKSGIVVKGDDRTDGAGKKSASTRLVNFEILPVHFGELRAFFFMIVFREDHTPPTRSKAHTPKHSVRQIEDGDSRRTVKLEQELAANKEYLQSVIETQEATNEELQSANEEILSSNEELQSTNEELETAKEELQSTNEELSTVNDELRTRNTHISTANTDLTNLLSSIDIAVVMLAPDVTIRRFTPQAEKLLGLIPADIGRPFLNLNPSIQVPELQQMVLTVIGDSKILETEVVTPDRGSFLLRILPYRTSEGYSEGAVITLMPTTGSKVGHASQKSNS